jgi:ribonuclease R
MQERLGEVYDGVISGVTEWGLYVELSENLCEGLIPIRDLADDYFDFDEKNYCLIGRRNNQRYTLGDEVKVQVARADLDKKQLDFSLVADKGNPNRPISPVRDSSRDKRKNKKSSRRRNKR